jgi:hypothetical protein
MEGPYFSNDGAQVAVRLRITGTMTGPLEPPGFGPTGRRLEFETAEFSHFDGELLVSHRVVLDMLALARQIFAAPGAGSLLDRTNVVLQRVSAWWSRRSRKLRTRAGARRRHLLAQPTRAPPDPFLGCPKDPQSTFRVSTMTTPSTPNTSNEPVSSA